MELIRQYKNAAKEDLRIDTIVMERRQTSLASKAQTHTFARNISKRPIHNTSVSDRVVAEIEIIGDFTEIDTTDYNWAKWDSPAATVEMSDLPKVGDTV